MRTMLAKQTELAVGIAKQHQLLAENFDRLGNVVQFLHRADHQPIAAKPLTGRGSGPDVREYRQPKFSVSFFYSRSSRWNPFPMSETA